MNQFWLFVFFFEIILFPMIISCTCYLEQTLVIKFISVSWKTYSIDNHDMILSLWKVFNFSFLTIINVSEWHAWFDSSFGTKFKVWLSSDKKNTLLVYFRFLSTYVYLTRNFNMIYCVREPNFAIFAKEILERKYFKM